MGKNKRITIPFYKKYEPAMIERFKNSSPIYEHVFNQEMGLSFIRQFEKLDEDYMVFEIFDEKLFMLAQIKYGF